MKRKWIVLTGVVMALGVLVSVAVAHRGERMRSGHGRRGMMQGLDLTEEQFRRVERRQRRLGELMERRGGGPRTPTRGK